MLPTRPSLSLALPLVLGLLSYLPSATLAVLLSLQFLPWAFLHSVALAWTVLPSLPYFIFSLSQLLSEISISISSQNVNLVNTKTLSTLLSAGIFRPSLICIHCLYLSNASCQLEKEMYHFLNSGKFSVISFQIAN